MAKPDVVKLFKETFLPHVEPQMAWIVAVLGMLGTIIPPYMLFWLTAEEKEEKKSLVQADEVGFDTLVGMIYSNLLAYCMIVTGALMLYGKGPISRMSLLSREHSNLLQGSMHLHFSVLVLL